MRYADFEYHAMEYFGLTGDEAAMLLDSIQAQGGSLRGEDADDQTFWVQASGALTDDILGIYHEYDLDPNFPDDEYLSAGDEWEMTAESEEGYGIDT